MLSANFSASAFNLVSGEPMTFTLQPFDVNGAGMLLTGRSILFCLYGDDGTKVSYTEGQIVSGDAGQSMLWSFPGDFSRSLYGSAYNWSFIERDHSGFQVIKSGRLTIDLGPKDVPDLSTAPISRYITRVSWIDDPNAPKFNSTVVAYASAVSQPPAAPYPTFDFSKPENSSMVVFL